MSRLATRRELARLASVIDLSAEQLDDLRDQPAEALAALRIGLVEHLFERHRRTFRRIGRLAGSVPSALAGRIAQSALGPAVSARTAATMEPGLAVKMADALPATFLAELSVQLDPQRARPIIAGLSDDRILEISEILLDRGEHLAMSRFLPVITPQLAVRVIATAERRVVLAIANLADDDSAIEQILEQLPVDDDVNLAAAIADDDVALDALSLAARVSPTNGARILRAVLPHPEVRERIAAMLVDPQLAAELARPLAALDHAESALLVG